VCVCVCVCVRLAWGIQSGGVSSSVGFNLSLYLESRATPGISACVVLQCIILILTFEHC
jgi:hypothetical protein